MHHEAGQHWILLRGLTREAGHWGEFPAQLQQAFPNAQIHTLDLPGAGLFYQQTSPTSIPEITRQCRQYALGQGWLSSKATLLTLSLGGMVAWEWQQQFADDVCAAALINTSLASLNPFYQRLRWQSYGKLARIMFQPDPYRRELAIIKLISNREANAGQTAQDWGQIQTVRPVSLSNALRQIVAAARYKPQANPPKVPVLLLNSLADRLAAPACSLAISQRWELPLATHTWAGHDLCLDDGVWVIKQLQQWLERIVD